MREQDQTAEPVAAATVSAEASAEAASEPGPVARQLRQVAEAHGLKPAEGRELMTLLAGLKTDSPIPLEAMATVSGILLLLFQAEARFVAAGGRALSAGLDIARALETALAEVVSANERVAGGKSVDITDLPDRMAPICAAISALPHEEALTHAPAVKALMGALDKITVLLRDRRDAMRQRLEQLEAMQS